MRLVVFEEVAEAGRGELGIIRKEWVEGEFEETVQCTSSCVDGGDARGGKHHVFLLHMAAHIAQKGTLTGAGLAGEEERMLRETDERKRILKFGR